MLVVTVIFIIGHYQSVSIGMRISIFNCDNLLCSIYWIWLVLNTKYWLKKGAGTAAIFEGVGISAPLIGRYVGRACGYRMVP